MFLLARCPLVTSIARLAIPFRRMAAIRVRRQVAAFNQEFARVYLLVYMVCGLTTRILQQIILIKAFFCSFQFKTHFGSNLQTLLAHLLIELSLALVERTTSADDPHTFRHRFVALEQFARALPATCASARDAAAGAFHRRRSAPTCCV